MRNNKIGFIGAGDWGYFFLDSLKRNDKIKIDKILTIEAKNNKIFNHKSGDFYLYENENDYKVFTDTDLSGIIMAGWTYKLPGKFINSLNCDVYNIHASLLPKYRGPEPLIRQLLNNESEGGVTIHRVDKGWDTGDICEQVRIKIKPDDNNTSLMFKASLSGRNILKKFIEKLINNEISFVKQDKNGSSYHSKINIQDFIIDKTKTIGDFYRIARAFYKKYPLIAFINGRYEEIFDFEFTDELSYGYNRIIELKDGFLLLKKSKIINL